MFAPNDSLNICCTLYYLIHQLKFHGSEASLERIRKGTRKNISSSSMIYFDYLLQLRDKAELAELEGYRLHSNCFIYCM